MKRLYFASLHDCNQNCLFCVRLGDNEPIRFIDTKKSKEILAGKRKEGYAEVCFDGGEPTLRQDLAELIDYAKKLKYRTVSILTNGVMLADEKLVKKLLAAGDSKDFNLTFSVSLHSHKKEISEKMTGSKGTFSQTLRGIENLIKHGCRNLSVYCIITKYNYKELPNYVKFIHERFPEINNITFSFMYPAGAALENIELYPRLSSVEPYFRKALALCDKYAVNYSISTCGTIPLCFMRGHEDLLISQQELDQPENVGLVDSGQDGKFVLATDDFHKKTKVKSTACLHCLFYEKCGGIWKVYVDKYGLGELKPTLGETSQSVFLLLTGSTCNNNCVFCSVRRGKAIDSSTDELKASMRRGYERGFRIIQFMGGEPSIRPDFIELAAYARELGYKSIGLTTNGRMFSYPEFMDRAVAAGLTDVLFTLHGHKAVLHDGITRTPGSFVQCVGGIKSALAHKGLNVVVNTVISRVNYKKLNKIGLFVKDLGVGEWHLLELLPEGAGKKMYDAYAVKLSDLAGQINKIKPIAKYFRKIEFYDFPFCAFDPDILKIDHISLITPRVRHKDHHQEAFKQKGTRISRGDNGEYVDKYKVKPEVCRLCRHYDDCGGIMKQYLDLYGDGEVRKLLAVSAKNPIIKSA